MRLRALLKSNRKPPVSRNTRSLGQTRYLGRYDLNVRRAENGEYVGAVVMSDSRVTFMNPHLLGTNDPDTALIMLRAECALFAEDPD